MDRVVDRQSIPADMADVPIGGLDIGAAWKKWTLVGLALAGLTVLAGIAWMRGWIFPVRALTRGRDWCHFRSASTGGSTGKPDIGSIQTR